MTRTRLWLLIIPVAMTAGFVWFRPLDLFLPGTQPNIVQTFESPNTCQTCHQTQASGHQVEITNDWKGSMMAHAAQDPLFYAAMAVANKDMAGIGEFCIRCHSPSGWLEGRSTPATGEGLTGNDLNGVQCDVCHRMKDPMIPDTTATPPVPGYGNGMFVLQVPRNPKRGPYADAVVLHPVLADSFTRRGDFCGVCHNVSNPVYADNATTQAPHLYGPIERTYSEWTLSWYATQGEAGTCQSCHMPAGSGYGAIMANVPLRADLPRHDLTGGNTFLPDILAGFRDLGQDTARLAEGKARATLMLQSAAAMEATALRQGDSVALTVTVTNLTGHKLPTGYPEGRRIWLSVTGTNAQGDTLFRSGAYDHATGVLTHDDQIKIYQVEPGLTPARAADLGLPAGPSFHFVLNDTIYSDNRIPPRGFANDAFASHLAQPVAYSYADGDYHDVTTYSLPGSVSTVSVTLLYQTASREYIGFLRDENTGNPSDTRHWGDSLYAAWERHGRSRPVSMEEHTVPVINTSVYDDRNGPTSATLLQNYPNPINPTTTIAFRVLRGGNVGIAVYDVTGRKVATVFRGRVEAGSHAVIFDGAALASGVYLYDLEVDGIRQGVRSLVLIR